MLSKFKFSIAWLKYNIIHKQDLTQEAENPGGQGESAQTLEPGTFTFLSEAS
jgi:hypothetical protein